METDVFIKKQYPLVGVAVGSNGAKFDVGVYSVYVDYVRTRQGDA